MARLRRDAKFNGRHIQLQEALQVHLQISAGVSTNFLDKLNQDAIVGMEE